MQYTHITMDVGVAMKAFRVIWNNKIVWSDILINPEDFHYMVMFFSVIGSYLKGIGFEEIIFQAKICQRHYELETLQPLLFDT